jgi:diguanylate cyclase (GGDEF)-like protein
MKDSFIPHHLKLIVIYLFVLSGTVCLALFFGQLKASSEFDHVDALGEGGMTLITFIWIGFTLLSRPKGKVTNWLFSGLLLMHVSMLLDFLDEFISYDQNNNWLTTIKSLPAPVGMVIMSMALYQLYQEQVTINAQLRRTEHYYRDHRLTDFITGLYSAEYMKQQLKRMLGDDCNNFSLIMLDIRQFDHFNRKHGHHHGDRLLREIAQLTLMSVRDTDLACRYASDRLIILLPNSSKEVGEGIALHIENSIAHLAFKVGENPQAVFQQATVFAEEFNNTQSYHNVLNAMNKHISQLKTQVRSQPQVA